MERKYKRIILKVSGEALAGKGKMGIDDGLLIETAKQVKRIRDLGVEVAVVPGGGNFWRGRIAPDMDRCSADLMGMFATVMNAIAVKDALRRIGVPAVAFSAIGKTRAAEEFSIEAARKALSEGTVVVLGGGVGDPFFTTDTGIVLRALEIEADAVLMGKSVDYVYDSDPSKNPDAKPYKRLSHDEVLQKKLGVIDATAAALARDNNLTLKLFGLADPENVIRAALGEEVGTTIE
jgi:uridylate kinase